MRDFRKLQEWLDRPEGGDFFLQGRESDIWNHGDDLLTLSRRHAERDTLTGLMNDFVAPLWYSLCSRWNKVCPNHPKPYRMIRATSRGRGVETKTQTACGIIGTIR